MKSKTTDFTTACAAPHCSHSHLSMFGINTHKAKPLTSHTSFQQMNSSAVEGWPECASSKLYQPAN